MYIYIHKSAPLFSQKEWDKELDELLNDLTPTDGANAGRVAVGEVRARLAFTRYSLLRGFCARMNHPCNTKPACIAHTIAILLHDYSAVYDPRSDILFGCHIPYNIGDGNIL